MIATANTKGQGSDDGKFIGTNILNEAFLERFPITVEQSYPTNKIETKILNNVMKFISTNEPSAWRQALSLVDTMGVTSNQAQQISDKIYNIIDEMYQDPDYQFNRKELRRLYAGEDIMKSGVVNRLTYEKDLERETDAYITKVMALERAVTDGLELLDYDKYGEEFGRYDVYNNSDLVKLMRIAGTIT